MSFSKTNVTESLCPVCLARIMGEMIMEGDDLFLVKQCPDHGIFKTIIWHSSPDPAGWSRQKGVVRSKSPYPGGEKGCPFDCGICSKHRQESCTILIEVTSRCNLSCTYCFANSGVRDTSDPTIQELSSRFRNAMKKSGPHNIVQLSGGEPTMRNDLPEVIAVGRDAGFPLIQLNTNGVRLATDPAYALELKRAGLFSVFLQFDGTDDRINHAIRGRGLLQQKLKSIENCAAVGLGVVLVPTVVKDINSDDIGAILKLALEYAPAVRGVHFQPAAYFGRHPEPPPPESRFTLPDLMRAIQEQTGGLIRADQFVPPGCEHPFCSFHGNFLRQTDGSLKPLSKQASGCCDSEPENFGTGKAVSYMANQWAAPKPVSCCAVKDSLDAFLEDHRSNTFAISAMAFQDIWNLDLERVQECCIHVAVDDERMVPFCLYNLTSAEGTPLYRNRQ